jgi:hypothetical protein
MWAQYQWGISGKMRREDDVAEASTTPKPAKNYSDLSRIRQIDLRSLDPLGDRLSEAVSWCG